MVKRTAHEKVQLRRETQARQRPDKDRTRHEAGRGLKAGATTSVISHELTDEQFLESANEMHNGSDRVAALLGAAFVENSLRTLIAEALQNDADPDALLDKPGALLGSFSAKIMAAKAFGIVERDLAKDMDVIRGVRNEFAHALVSVNFSHPAIAARCTAIMNDGLGTYSYPDADRPDLPEARVAFENRCWTVASLLLRKATRRLKDKTAAHQVAMSLADPAKVGREDALSEQK